MKVSCSCGATYNVPESYAGRKVKCKRCKESFIAGGGAGQPVTRPAKRKKKQLSKAEREDAPVLVAAANCSLRDLRDLHRDHGADEKSRHRHSRSIASDLKSVHK